MGKVHRGLAASKVSEASSKNWNLENSVERERGAHFPIYTLLFDLGTGIQPSIQQVSFMVPALSPVDSAGRM